MQATQAHAARTRVFDGVRDQVFQDLFDQRPVAVNAIGTGLYLQLQAFVGRYGLVLLYDSGVVRAVASEIAARQTGRGHRSRAYDDRK